MTTTPTFLASLTSTAIRRRTANNPRKESVSLGYPCESTKQCQISDPRSVCGRGGVCVCKSAKEGTIYEEIRNGLGKGRRKRRRRRKIIKALYGDGQVSESNDIT